MQTPQIVYAARSDKGRARRNNEDNLYCCGTILTSDIRDLLFRTDGMFTAPAIFAVFDGIGGEQLGEQASLTAAQTLKEHAGIICGTGSDQIDAAVKTFVAAINQRLQDESKRTTKRMGTTMALAVVMQSEIRIYSIGDSRIYALDRDGLHQINIDHTLAMRKVADGLLTETEARQSSDWSKLTACLGIPGVNGTYSEVQVNSIAPLLRKVKLMLCSDGLTDMVPDDRIEQILRSSKTVEKATQNLMSEALNNGGRDNTTIIVAEVQRGSSLLGRLFRQGGEK